MSKKDRERKLTTPSPTTATALYKSYIAPAVKTISYTPGTTVPSGAAMPYYTPLLPPTAFPPPSTGTSPIKPKSKEDVLEEKLERIATALEAIVERFC